MKEDEKVNIGLMSHGVHYNITVSKSIADKMGEIRGRNPEKWKDNQMELLLEAKKALEEK
jgi:hypothetical protein